MVELTTPAESASSAKGLGGLLVVDERDSSRLVTKWFFANLGYRVHTARSADEALALFDPNLHDLVVTDRCRSAQHGVEFAQLVKQRSASTPVVLFAAKPPADRSCFEAFVARPGHLLLLKSAIDEIKSGPDHPHQTRFPA